MPQVMRPKKGCASCHCIQCVSNEKPFEKLLGRTNVPTNSFLSLSLSVLFHNLFTRLVLITRESYDFVRSYN